MKMKGAEFTFGGFEAECNRVAHGLADLGVSKGQMVSVMLPNSPEFVLAWLALCKLGAVEAPVNTEFRGSGLAHVLGTTGSSLLVVDERYLDALGAVAGSLPDLRTLVVRGDVTGVPRRFPGLAVLPFEALYSGKDGAPGVPVADTDPCALMFTSGTTGRSKACVLSHRYVVQNASLMAEHFGLRPDDVLYCPFPLFHVDAAVFTVAPALLLGATAALGERFSASRFWGEVREFGATVFDFMGATLTMLNKQPPRPDDADNPARLAWGLPVPEWAGEFEERFGLRLAELYGLTDAGVVVYQPLNEPRRPGACGKAVWPYDVRIHDDEDEELPPGEIGEIVVRPMRPHVIMEGYHGMPEETVKACRNLWFHTGDLARKDGDGYFYFVGRKKDAIRRRGENISAFEIEEIVSGHPDVLEAAAVGVPSELTEEDVKVCVVLQQGSALSPEDLVSYCKGKMARFMVPRFVEFLEDLPKTPTEKIEKYKLKERGVTGRTWDSRSATSLNNP
jgi:crotonobetaine/carnitine-CoA ligase